MKRLFARKRILCLTLVLLSAGILAACSGQTTSATNVTPVEAHLNAQASCNGTNGGCYWYWRWGTNTSPSSWTYTDSSFANHNSGQAGYYGPAGNTNGNVTVGEPISGLQPNTTYYYQLCGYGDGSGSYSQPNCVGPSGNPNNNDYSSFTTGSSSWRPDMCFPEGYTGGDYGNGCDPPLRYQGGTVIENPHVYEVFWGPDWYSTYGPTLNAVDTFAHNIAGSLWASKLHQYYVNDPVFYSGANTTSMPGTVGWSDLAAAAHAWWSTADPNGIYVVIPEPNSGLNMSSVCGNFGGVHRAVAYGGSTYNIATLCPNTSSNASSSSYTISHEIAEAATDPGISGYGWLTNGTEIGDLCNYVTSSNSVGGQNTEAIFDNGTFSCQPSAGGARAARLRHARPDGPPRPLLRAGRSRYSRAVLHRGRFLKK